MSLLTGNVTKLYFHYLTAAFGSALIVAVYSIVDCAVVGQYEGASGVAVLMRAAKGRRDEQAARQLFRAALIGAAAAAVLSGGIFNIFGDCFFVFVCDMGIFGAGSFLLPAAACADALWLAMPVTELITAVIVVSFMVRFSRSPNRITPPAA